jgi:adenylate kinase
MLPNVHILGIQGSGKGTQSSLLVERYGFTYASSGNLFRERAELTDPFGRQLAAQLSTGKLLPNSLLIDTIAEYLEFHKVTTGFLGDGVIRTLEQYEKLKPVWTDHDLGKPILIHLVLTEEVALRRIDQRKKEQADPTRQEYHLKYSGKLLHRTDDNPLAIQERFQLFHTMTAPVISLFTTLDRCIDINADQTVEAIQAEIRQHLERLYPQLHHVTA